MRYTYARLGRGDLGFYRLFGEGLGNTLFPWARSILAARKDHLTEIWPTWRQLFHRGGWKDVWKEAKGNYGLKKLRNYDALFEPSGTQIIGCSKLALLLRCQKISEEKYLRLGINSLPDDCVVTFEGMRGQYADLTGAHEFLRAELWNRTVPAIRARIAAQDLRRTICIHVRLGDFPNNPLADVLELRHNSRLPQSWYVEKIKQVRASLHEDWPVLIFSDGLDSELSEVLSVPGSRRVSFGSALADLWAMASAAVVVCSLSTLNNWACYLGRPPAIRLRGVMNEPLYSDDPEAEIESGVNEEIPNDFIERVRKRARSLSAPWQV